MQLAFKYRIYPSSEQKVYLEKQFGCCRFVYNYFLNMCSENKNNLVPSLKTKQVNTSYRLSVKLIK